MLCIIFQLIVRGVKSMIDKLRSNERIWFKVCIFLVGLLIGIGSTQVSIASKVNVHEAEITNMKVDISECIIIQKAMLESMQTIINQNTVLINAVASP